MKLICMFAVWEYEEGNWRSISFLKLVKILMALTLDEGHSTKRCSTITIPKSMVSAEGLLSLKAYLKIGLSGTPETDLLKF